MALPSELAKAELTWAIENGAEIAVNTIWFRHVHHTSVSFSWGDALQQIADHVVDSLKGPGAALTGYMHGSIQLAKVDAYAIPPIGDATDKRTHTCSANEFRGGGTGMMPPLVAPVIQLWGYKPAEFTSHPARHRGRLYFPGMTQSMMSGDGLLSPEAQTALRDAWAAVLNDLQGMHVGDVPGPGPVDSMDVGVLSRRDQAFYQLEAVTVAHKLGVQRRRMNKLQTSRSAPATINHG